MAPTYQRLFGSYWLLWYKKSNVYSIVDDDFKNLLYNYLECSSLDEFKSKFISVDSSIDTTTVIHSLNSYLEQCHTKTDDIAVLDTPFNASKRQISVDYNFNNRIFRVNFDSDLVKKTIHPSIAHLETNAFFTPDIIYDVYIEDDRLCLFKNEVLVRTVPKRDYHLIQGKFAMELLSFIHHKDESDWLGTFHGSTISDGKNSILFIGASGKGKSTLCALLSAQGFELVADDVSPMLAKDSRIYHNPSAISIKEGAFDLLRPLVDDFDSLPNTLFNKTKGVIKHLPCKSPIKDCYPCSAIIMVNYSKGSKTSLESISIKEALETLIPESWLSPKPLHASQFLDWLSQTPVYKLTYSNTESVTKEITACFKQFNSD
ncbi:hypothetical protein [Winogradskyella algicola]|uniref:hypothetical protein n=1 Tax=Winogradskyella algicola TaxID=2575815 RepID=UPI00148666CE|nr:hypothetical protein [Winogradskyella algicola]